VLNFALNSHYYGFYNPKSTSQGVIAHNFSLCVQSVFTYMRLVTNRLITERYLEYRINFSTILKLKPEIKFSISNFYHQLIKFSSFLHRHVTLLKREWRKMWSHFDKPFLIVSIFICINFDVYNVLISYNYLVHIYIYICTYTNSNHFQVYISILDTPEPYKNGFIRIFFHTFRCEALYFPYLLTALMMISLYRYI
jgi:hypothetical protein